MKGMVLLSKKNALMQVCVRKKAETTVVRNIFHIKKYYVSRYTVKHAKKNVYLN